MKRVGSYEININRCFCKSRNYLRLFTNCYQSLSVFMWINVGNKIAFFVVEVSVGKIMIVLLICITFVVSLRHRIPRAYSEKRSCFLFQVNRISYKSINDMKLYRTIITSVYSYYHPSIIYIYIKVICIMLPMGNILSIINRRLQMSRTGLQHTCTLKVTPSIKNHIIEIR